MKTLFLEDTRPFQGLCELVADAEGLFEKEGLKVEWVKHDDNLETITDTQITNHHGSDPFNGHGAAFEQGKADMYNACEWGNYCRAQDSKTGLVIGRRSIVTYAALVVRPESNIYTPQQFANRQVGVPFFYGTHYLALQMLEGFMTRDQISLCKTSPMLHIRYQAMMRGEVDSVILVEPYISLAEKQGCRIICSAFFHGTEVASAKVDSETYGMFNRAVREAVKRINANKKQYLQYFIDHYKDIDPLISMLSINDLPESRLVVVDPAPIPAKELEQTANWIKSWGMLENTDNSIDLINMDINGNSKAQGKQTNG